MSRSLFEKGKEQYGARDFEGAILSFTLSLEKDPGNAEVLYERAMAYFHLGKSNLALMDMDRALEFQPNNPYRYASRAYMKDAIGDIIGAINDYRKAIELDPDDAVSHNNLGLLEEKMGYMDSANRHYKVADKLHDHQGIRLPDSKNSSPEALDNTENAKTLWQIIRDLFRDKNARKEFVDFVKSGFKLKNKS